MIKAVWVRNGRLYAGTRGQGVIVSDNLGTTWLAFNQGLVGGIFNTQNFIDGFLVHGDSLYAVTEGAGVWVRNLAAAGTWHHFGEIFEPNAASTVAGIGASDTRLVAAAGGNGMVFFRDPGDAEWTRSFLNNVGFAPGIGAQAVAWTGHGWVVGSNFGVFISPTGQEPWTRTDPVPGPLFNVSFALRGRDVFADFGTGGGTVIGLSRDDGVTWQLIESQDFVFTSQLAIRGNDLYAGRLDGLWRRSIDTVSEPDGGAPTRLRLAIAGSQPIGDDVRFRFDLPAPGAAAIEVFDVTGRRTGDPIRGSWPAGPNEVAWDAHGLSAGVYMARLRAGREQAVLRMIRAR
jgi:hypothetical protein